jgi:hypothetical protein
MKKTALALLLLLSLNACKKDDSKPAPAIDNVNISGLSDHTMNFTRNDTVGIDVHVTDPAQQPKVTLSIEGLPAGIGSSFSSSEGYPDFHSRLSFSLDSIVTPGTYPLKLTAAIAGQAQTKTFDFKLTVPAFNGIMVNDSFIAVTGIIGVYSQGFSLALAPYWIAFNFYTEPDADRSLMRSYLLVPEVKAPGQAAFSLLLLSRNIPQDKPFMITASLSADSSKVTLVCPRVQVGTTSFMANFTIPVTK